MPKTHLNTPKLHYSY